MYVCNTTIEGQDSICLKCLGCDVQLGREKGVQFWVQEHSQTGRAMDSVDREACEVSSARRHWCNIIQLTIRTPRGTPGSKMTTFPPRGLELGVSLLYDSVDMCLLFDTGFYNLRIHPFFSNTNLWETFISIEILSPYKLNNALSGRDMWSHSSWKRREKLTRNV